MLLPQTSNEFLEKLKNNLKSTNRSQPKIEQQNEFDMVKLKSRNSKRSNSIDLDNNDEPIYDNISSSSSNLANNKQKSLESSDEDLIEQSSRNNMILRKRTPSDAPKSSSRKTTIITSSNDIDISNNICKLGHSKSMKYVDSFKINLKSPSTNDLNKQQFSGKIETITTNTTNEPTWREMALKKQSAWINNSVENLLNNNNNRSINHQNEVFNKNKFFSFVIYFLLIRKRLKIAINLEKLNL